jgi:hypothetical protein
MTTTTYTDEQAIAALSLLTENIASESGSKQSMFDLMSGHKDSFNVMIASFKENGFKDASDSLRAVKIFGANLSGLVQEHVRDSAQQCLDMLHQQQQQQLATPSMRG